MNPTTHLSRLSLDLNGLLDRQLGLAGVRPQLVRRVRRDQIERVLRNSPLLLGANVVNALVTLAVLADHPARVFVIGWAAAIVVLAANGVLMARANAHNTALAAAPVRLFDRAARHALILGSLWGVLPLMTFAAASPAQQFFIACVMTGMFSGGALALATVPLAALMYALPLALGAFGGLALEDGTSVLAVEALLVVYCGVIGAICLGHARAFAERSLARIRVEDQNQIISLLLRDYERSSSDWLWEIDEQHALQHVSVRFAEVLGLSPEGAAGIAFAALFGTGARTDTGASTDARTDTGADAGTDTGADAGTDAGTGHPVLRAIAAREPFHHQIVPVWIGGDERWWMMAGRPMVSRGGQYLGYRGFASDITTARRAEERVSFLARHDVLTGVANRAAFTEALDTAIARLRRQGEPFALMLVDLDRFKSINDTFGHPVGDAVLAEVARRLGEVSRGTDTVGRLGGDEFAVLQAAVASPVAVEGMARRIVEAFVEPFEFDGVRLQIGVSVGVAMAPQDGADAEALMHCADLALYRAKGEGRGVARFFEQGMGEAAAAERRLEAELREAVAKRQFVVQFQPLVDAQDGELRGFEALVRWDHPVRGRVPPGEFIALAERIGLIRLIGDLVIDEACRNAATWPAHLHVSVNLSPLQLDGPEIVDTVRTALRRHGVAAPRLELEITESALMQHADLVAGTLHELRALGVSIAMDDFGTGYSSLSSLWRFPFDNIKIDQSFIRALDHDASAREILRTISRLGSSLRLCITAEGVESAEHVEFLRSIDCDRMQGFHFGHPLDAAAVTALLAARNPHGAAAD